MADSEKVKVDSAYVGLYMSKKLHDELISLAGKRELSISSFIRQILIDYVEVQNKKELI